MPKPSTVSYYPNRKSMTVTKVGEWGKLLPLAQKLRHVGPQAYTLLRAESLLAAEALKARIRNRYYDGQWEPLTEDWVQRKASQGLDPRMLIARGDYVNAIHVIPAGPRVVQIGIDKNATGFDGINLAGLGFIHEFGAGPVPARPHWRDAYRDIETKLHAGFLGILASVEAVVR